ncbi:hypothetical protein D3C80_1183980 [compost metagenome]
MTHCPFKGGIRPFANAGFVIRSDVGGVDGAEWDLHRQPAGIAFTARPGMANRTVAEIGQHFATDNLLLTKNVGLVHITRRNFRLPADNSAGDCYGDDGQAAPSSGFL